ncbi:hypothetical protein [Pseudomonas sp. NPDC089406]|uniref:hypothetical protein n=1 Tax=Pseudomonas sp. NPDC089406 TaxID=3364463 RepID=UPI00384B7811
MKWLKGLIFFAPYTHAVDDVRQGCIGRSVFEIPEPLSWSTVNIRKARIDFQSSPMFSGKIGGLADHVEYAGDRVWYRVSTVTTRYQFERARQAVLLDSEGYVESLWRQLKAELKKLSTLSKGADDKEINRVRAKIAELKGRLASPRTRDFDIGLPDAFALGNDTPYKIFLWRNNRVYYFYFSQPEGETLESVKNLMARFEPRDSNQIPKGPGVCMPYGFIHDDGLATFSIKSTLRFDSTPNVVMSIINASAEYAVKPTLGTYNTHYYPGYDRQRWKKSSILQAIDLGGRKTILKGWRLDPRPGSGEEERAWFASAHVGGLDRPLLAVHMETFPKGSNDLETLTPTPDEVIPKFLKITESLRNL